MTGGADIIRFPSRRFVIWIMHEGGAWLVMAGAWMAAWRSFLRAPGCAMAFRETPTANPRGHRMTILDRLKDVRSSGDGWAAKCPGHDDAHSSLSIHHRDGKWLLKCHAGCSIEEVTSAVGLKTSDLFDADARKQKANGRASFIAEYIYRTADGEPSRKVCRTADKSFPQFKWTGSRWESGTEGVPILPYRLPELIKTDPETPVFICEGEKDCDRLAALGFVATTNPMGAGKWRAALNKWFTDRPVFIIPDNDDPGRKHAADVARHLKPIAARVRIVEELPGLTKKGGDVSDWLDLDRGNKDRLLDVATAPPAKPQTIDGAALLADVYAFLGRYVVYPSQHARVAHTLWIAHAHCMDAWESTPRIAFLSPEPASGKTRALEVSVLLVPLPVEAINVTPAYLFRKVGGEEGLPTILYDEIDTVFGPKAKDNEEVRALLNAGHRRGAVAGRCVVRGKTVETEEIPAYCAVALAGLGWLPETVMTRSIIVQMRRRAPGERVQPFRRRLCLKEGNRLRNRLAAWGRSAADHLTDNWPELPEGIADRDADVWEPIVALAEFAGGDWPKWAREAATEMVKAGKDREPSLGIRLLADLRTIFADAEEMASEVVVHRLVALTEAPWGDLKGRPLDQRGLARRLRQYEVRPKQLRLSAGKARGYCRADLRDAWDRYVPPSPATSGTSGTSGTNAENSAESRTTSEDSSRYAGDADRYSTAQAEQNVPLNVSDVPDETAQAVHATHCKTSDVPDVPDVPSGSEEPEVFPRVCEHCGAPENPGEPVNEVYADDRLYLIHAACIDGWLGDDDLT
jgi:5S rRNA maturation endonuclease (ribonuclease M5)